MAGTGFSYYVLSRFAKTTCQINFDMCRYAKVKGEHTRFYLLYASSTHSFSGTKIKQEMAEKFAAFLTVCSSVEDLEYVVLTVYTVFSL